MDCFEARRRFFELTLFHGDAGDCGGTDLLRRHLDECAECRAEFEAECARDRSLARTVQAVDIPRDLKSRLLQSMAAQQDQPASSPAIGRRPIRSRRTALAVAFLGVAVCVAIVVHSAWPVTLTLAELELLVDRSNAAGKSPPATPLERPSGWRQLRSVTEQSEATAHPLVGVVQFTFRPRGAAGASTGRLWILPAARLAGAESLPDLAMAEMQYRPQAAHLVWQESGTVYLLEFGDDLAALRQLHEALLRTRTVA